MSRLGLFFSLIWLALFANATLADIVKYDKVIIEDAHLKTHELIRKYGYPAEVHKVSTKDGFVLTVHRIPRPGAQPVLLTHGLLDSSATWVLMGPGIGLGYLLHDKGYDVWMLNVRGNRYSRRHLRYHPIMPEFWNFSFHELGIYDLPAAIDYVLSKTGFPQLHYIGHSQGTTSFFVMGSERPAYMAKVKLMQALAPVAYCDSLEQPFVNLLAPLTPYIPAFFNIIKAAGLHEYLPGNDVWRDLIYKICSFALPNTCSSLIWEIMGRDMSQLNATMLPVIFGHVPAGTSVKSLAHYSQLFRSGGFYKFKDGRGRPKQYKLANVNCKVALYYSKNDWLSSVRDVRRLRDAMPNVVHDHLITFDKFNHIDYTWAIDARQLLYDDMIEVMRKVDSNEL